MSSQALGILIGGVLPAFIFGVSNVFMKLATQKGIAFPLYVVFTGLAVVIVGIVLFLITPDRQISLASGSVAFLAGVCWASGVTCAVIALQYYGSPIAVLTPLFNMNTLVTVVLGLWIFAEWRTVSVSQLLIGTVLITVGAVLVARA